MRAKPSHTSKPTIGKARRHRDPQGPGPTETPRPPKTGLHPRNRHGEGYDFLQLLKSCPELVPFVSRNAYGNESIDFADPAAVRALNRALLITYYGISTWELPPLYLCPPVPGRADYLHHLADLLGSSNGGTIPRGASIRILDIGVGANCVYPLIGHHEYGWSFLGSDIDPLALGAAGRILSENPGLDEAIQLRLQPTPPHVLKCLLQFGEVFDASICNPPFHGSPGEAQEGSKRKWQNLGRAPETPRAPVLNFGGQSAELWCEGGEVAFVRRLIQESALIPTKCFWFTSLLSKEASLPSVRRALKKVGALETRILDMAQGQKKSRIVAWTFLTREQQNEWRARHWGPGKSP